MSNKSELNANNIDLENLLEQALAMPTTEEVLNEAKTYTEEYAAPAGFGLGGSPSTNLTTLEELDVVRGSGWYTFARIGTTINGVYFNYALVKFDTHSANQAWQELRPMATQTVLKRAYYNGTWSEWECDNPPMVAGVEYRTTERYNGKPVYTMLLDFGTSADQKVLGINLNKDTYQIIRYAGTMNGTPLPYDWTDNTYGIWFRIYTGSTTYNAMLHLRSTTHANQPNTYLQIWYCEK